MAANFQRGFEFAAVILCCSEDLKNYCRRE